MAMVSHNGNIWHCARLAFRPVGIPPSHGRHLAFTRQFSLVGIPPVGIRACTKFAEVPCFEVWLNKDSDNWLLLCLLPFTHS